MRGRLSLVNGRDIVHHSEYIFQHPSFKSCKISDYIYCQCMAIIEDIFSKMSIVFAMFLMLVRTMFLISDIIFDECAQIHMYDLNNDQ